MVSGLLNDDLKTSESTLRVPMQFGPYPDTLEATLRRRGHQVIATGDVRQILLPEDQLGEVVQTFWANHGIKRAQEVFRQDPRGRYYQLFGQASFRKLARRLVLAHGEPVQVAHLRENAGERVGEYIEFLEALGVVESSSEGIRCTRRIDNFGPSLEHYVARLCVLEFLGTSEWGVLLEGLPHAGGDYDVLAWLSPALVYVECKSARPEDVGDEQLRHFMQRHVELAPDLGILLVDTDDNLGALVDRINAILSPIIAEGQMPDIIHAGGDAGSRILTSQPDYPGVWFGSYLGLYATNANPSIERQLRRCLQHFYALVRGRAIVPAALPHFVDTQSKSSGWLAGAVATGPDAAAGQAGRTSA
jgi:hypothetical protein